MSTFPIPKWSRWGYQPDYIDELDREDYQIIRQCANRIGLKYNVNEMEVFQDIYPFLQEFWREKLQQNYRYTPDQLCQLSDAPVQRRLNARR